MTSLDRLDEDLELSAAGEENNEQKNQQETLLKLVCKDRKALSIDRWACRQSVVLWQALESDEQATEIELHELDSDSVQRAVKYMEYHAVVPARTIPMPLTSTDMREMVDGWDGDFLESFDQNETFRLLLVANYLNIPNLLSLLCAKIASLMKSRTPQEIRRTFNIREFTDEERQRMSKEFADLVE